MTPLDFELIIEIGYPTAFFSNDQARRFGATLVEAVKAEGKCLAEARLELRSSYRHWPMPIPPRSSHQQRCTNTADVALGQLTAFDGVLEWSQEIGKVTEAIWG